MHELEQITHTPASIEGGQPKLWLDADEEEARLAGLTLVQIAEQFHTALEGATGGHVLENLEDLPVRVRYASSERRDTGRIATLRLASPAAPDGWVPAAAIGVLSLRPETASITRRNGERTNTIQGWLRPKIAGIIGLVAVLSVGLGMLSLWVGGYPLGFNPIIGSAGLVGVAINASIVVLAAIRANPLASGGDLGNIVGETLGATRHIVSTTLTTIGGFLPLLLFWGGDCWPPLAIVIAGGVGLSISLGLIFTPAVYRLITFSFSVAPTRTSAGSWDWRGANRD